MWRKKSQPKKAYQIRVNPLHMLPLPGSELVLSRGSRRQQEQDHVVGSLQLLSFLPYFLLEGIIKLSWSKLPLFPSSPSLLITTSFLFPYSHSGFPLFSSQIFSFSSFSLTWLAILFFFSSVLLGRLTHNLFPYSSLLFHSPFQSDLKLLHHLGTVVWWSCLFISYAKKHSQQ